ncbi:allantoin permease [Penicillium brasilianum]|uniref:Allantoin permease n=1 Tax=Penicillium brasilianum TaxID=104259 RepID=A0A1S9S145_PENBI|nr:allantoin permease [Penicillium brasilianum]
MTFASVTALTTSSMRRRGERIKKHIEQKKSPSGWVLPRQTTTFADEGSWSNIDSDVTPIERRTWSTWTVLGFWFSDALNAQGWECAASIIAIGLTWREALYCLIIGYSMVIIPLVLNGAIGAHLHVNFAVASRSSFGFYLSRGAVVIRMITALFWHAIQTYTGSTAMTQIIRAIWPSYLNIPNSLPASAGITSQQMCSHVLFWSLQFPLLLIPPHKLRWFFAFKTVVVLITSIATVIALCVQAGGAGEIWAQQATVSGSAKNWLILRSMSSITGSWLTMGTNIPDFTRYLKRSNGVYWQALFMPFLASLIGIFGIIAASAGKVLYGSYIWDPVQLAAQWDGPSGRCGAFFVGLSWVVAQIGTNISANVISCSNDMTTLWPKYINLRRGAIITTIIGGWVMVPWKIISSAASLLTFMASLAVFLAPICAIMAADYWIVKRQHIDIPSLFRHRGIYRYNGGFNWRAAVVFLISVAPNLPGMAHAVTPSLSVGTIDRIYDISFMWGFTSAFFVYCALNYFWPATATLVKCTIYEEMTMVNGVPVYNDGLATPSEGKPEAKFISPVVSSV